MAFWGAMQRVCKGGTAEQSEWQPYYDLLIRLAKEKAASGKNVVITYAVFGIFGGAPEKELFLQHFPTMKFIEVKVSRKILMERFWVRDTKMKQEAGMTDQEFWESEEMAEARAEYGETYKKENAEKFYLSTVYHPSLVKINPKEKNCFAIDNNDLKSNKAVKQLNKIAGLPWEKVDNDAISQINYDRYKNLKDVLAKKE